jgi:hypothetical protein
MSGMTNQTGAKTGTITKIQLDRDKVPAFAWVKWASAGSGTINSSHNIAGMTEPSDGHWLFTFTTNPPNSNYCCLCTCSGTYNSSGPWILMSEGQNTANFGARGITSTGAWWNPSANSALIISNGQDNITTPE